VWLLLTALATTAALALGPGLSAAAEPPDEVGGLDPPAAPNPPPTITGSAGIGQMLTGSRGGWEARVTEFEYAWLRCDATGGACVATGDTDLAYTVTAADAGSTLRLRVKGTDPALVGGGFRITHSAARYVPVPPASSSAPTLAGEARDGRTLTGTNGTWTGTAPITFAYRWRRCNADGSGCADVVGATAPTYTLTAADVGKRLHLRVTASGPENPNAAFSDSPLSAVVQAAPPVNVARPTVEGALRAGEVMVASPGSWAGTAPIAYAYSWSRCEATCTPTGVTTRSLRLTPADVGKRMEVRVTATNAGGSAVEIARSGLVAGGGGSSDGGSGSPRRDSSLRRLSPFPRVLVAGRLVGRGTLITSLAVLRVPRGATVEVRCRGRDCPYRRIVRRIRGSSKMRLRAFERQLRRGTLITIVVRKGRRLGKHTLLRIRRGAVPRRLDRCVRPGSRRPISCPDQGP